MHRRAKGRTQTYCTQSEQSTTCITDQTNQTLHIQRVPGMKDNQPSMHGSQEIKFEVCSGGGGHRDQFFMAGLFSLFLEWRFINICSRLKLFRHGGSVWWQNPGQRMKRWMANAKCTWSGKLNAFLWPMAMRKQRPSVSYLYQNTQPPKEV